MYTDNEVEQWIELVLNAQVLMGLAVVISTLGWSLWRLLLLLGWVNRNSRKEKKTTTQKISAKRTGSTLRKKSTPSISRQALYSSRRHFN